MAVPPLLHLRDIHLTFGGAPLLEGAELAVAPGERVCLVGRNGSGKSTLLKIAAGLVDCDRGERFVQPGATMRYLPQEPDMTGFASTSAYVEAGLAPGDDANRARYLLEALGLTGEENPVSLSGGEARRVALARTLAPAPDILLLDEPTNHLDLPAIEWLEAELRGTRAALVLISHDRRLLASLSQATVWLDRGSTRRLDEGFAAFEPWRDAVLEQEEADRHKLARRIAREEDWLRYGVTARRKRNERRLRDLHELRRRHREHRGPQGPVALEASMAEASGKTVIEAVGLSKSYGEAPVVRDFSIRIARGERLGIVGPNGAGKTTLIRLLTGDLEPDAGALRLGANVAIAAVDQRRATLDPSMTLADALTGGSGDVVRVGEATRHVVSYMKDFLFAPQQARSPLGSLSGGERGRLMLARALAQPANLLVLDEPTNDLDLETLDLLEELLAGYDGTLLLVSHDRDFLDRVATSVVASEGGGAWVQYAGGYSDMLAQRKGSTERAGETARRESRARPARLRAGTEAADRPRMTFKDKHALQKLPARIAELEGAIARMNADLADAGLFARDPDRFHRLVADLDAATRDLAEAEERWIELELLREESGG